MSNRKELEKSIAKMEAELEKMKLKLKKEDELKPFDWSGVDRWELVLDNSKICIESQYDNYPFLFNFDTEEQAKNFARQLELTSLILNLKKSLGDDGEFKGGYSNFSVIYTLVDSSWHANREGNIRSIGDIYFSSEENAHKVADYLNKNWEW